MSLLEGTYSVSRRAIIVEMKIRIDGTRSGVKDKVRVWPVVGTQCVRTFFQGMSRVLQWGTENLRACSVALAFQLERTMFDT